MRLLNSHPDIQCISEPFNPDSSDSVHGTFRITDPASLDEALTDIWKRNFNAIKHVWAPLGWPFANNPEFNKLLILKRDQRILFLNRKNYLRRLVSSHISAQTNIWGIFNENDRKKVLKCKFKPLDIEFVKRKLEVEKKMVTQYRRLLLDNHIEFLELWYEQLYEPSLTAQQHLEGLNQILAFLGHPGIFSDKTVAQVNRLFDPKQAKLNSDAIYRMIPGVEELESQCGSDETGWLFGGGGI